MLEKWSIKLIIKSSIPLFTSFMCDYLCIRMFLHIDTPGRDELSLQPHLLTSGSRQLAQSCLYTLSGCFWYNASPLFMIFVSLWCASQVSIWSHKHDQSQPLHFSWLYLCCANTKLEPKLGCLPGHAKLLDLYEWRHAAQAVCRTLLSWVPMLSRIRSHLPCLGQFGVRFAYFRTYLIVFDGIRNTVGSDSKHMCNFDYITWSHPCPVYRNWWTRRISFRPTCTTHSPLPWLICPCK